MATIQSIAGYYVDRLALQYRTLPKARATVAIAVKQVLADDVSTQLRDAYDVDAAVGDQLDVIGKYVGVPRNIGIAIAQGYFGLWFYGSTLAVANYKGTWTPETNSPTLPAAAGGNTGWWYVARTAGTSTSPIAGTWLPGEIIVSDGTAWSRRTVENGNGLTTYGDNSINPNGIFYSYATASRQASDLTDASYRTVLKLKIILNSNDGTLGTIVALLDMFFPRLITVTDNADMTMNYYVVSTVPLSKDLLMVYLPKPMGVGITVTIISPLPPDPTGGHLTAEDGTVLTTEDGMPILREPITT